MAANVESMFFVGEVPWHGLGVELDKPPTSKDAIVAAGLDWEVKAEPIFTQDMIEIEDGLANVRQSDRAVLGLVKKRYEIVQNVDAFSFMDNVLGDGVTFESAGSLANGRKTWLLARLPAREILGDKVDPYLVLANSFDGSSSVTVTTTPVRVVCQNTLTMALSHADRTFSFRHTNTVLSKMKTAENAIRNACGYMDELNFMAEKMSQTAISNFDARGIIHDLFDYVPDAPKATVNRAEDNEAAFMYLLNTKADIRPFLGTQYALYLAATDFDSHRAPVRKTARWKERAFERIVDGRSDTLITQKLLTALAA